MGILMQGFREDRRRSSHHHPEMGDSIGTCLAGTDAFVAPPSEWLPEGAKLLAFSPGDDVGPAARSAAVLEQGLPALDFLAAGGDPVVVGPWFDGRFYGAKPKRRNEYLAAIGFATSEKEVVKASVKEPFDSPFAGLAQLLKRS